MAKQSQIILPFSPLFCRWFGHYFAFVGKIDTTSLARECSCILCPNIEHFCPNNGQFFSFVDATASPASPCSMLMSESPNCSSVATGLDMWSKRKISAKSDAQILKKIKQKPSKNSGEIKNDLPGAGVKIKASLEQRWLVTTDRKLKTVKKQLFPSAMKRKRVKWANKYKHWTENKWKKCCFPMNSVDWFKDTTNVCMEK